MRKRTSHSGKNEILHDTVEKKAITLFMKCSNSMENVQNKGQSIVRLFQIVKNTCKFLQNS